MFTTELEEFGGAAEKAGEPKSNSAQVLKLSSTSSMNSNMPFTNPLAF
jgi:hypothetical protein